MTKENFEKWLDRLGAVVMALFYFTDDVMEGMEICGWLLAAGVVAYGSWWLFKIAVLHLHDLAFVLTVLFVLWLIGFCKRAFL